MGPCMNLERVAKSELHCSQLQTSISQICIFLQLFKQNSSGDTWYTGQYLFWEQKIQIACQQWQRSLKVLYLMSFEMFGKHREITGIVVLKHFDFGCGGYSPSYDCNLVMFNASDLLNSSTSFKTKD